MQVRVTPLASPLASAALAVGLIGALEAFHLPPAYREHPVLSARVGAHAAVLGWHYLAGSVVSLALLGPLVSRLRSWPARVGAATAAVSAAWLYPWAFIPPYFSLPVEALQLAGAGSAFALAALVVSGVPHARLRWAITVLGVAAFAALHWVNHTQHVRLYPHVHLLFFQVSALLLASALLEPVSHLLTVTPRAGHAALLAAPLIALAAGRGVVSHVHAHTLLGRGLVLLSPMAERTSARGAPLAADPDAERRFEAESGLPRLPATFRLDDHDLLLVMIESLRWDATGLGGAGEEITPHLDALAREALVFARASTPSTGTLASSAAIHTLKHPSAVKLEIWQKSWLGEVHAEEVTAAEVLAAAGRSTFWVGHDYRGAFEIDMLGLEQGFQQVLRERTADSGHDEDIDLRIERRATATLAAIAAEGRRAFGWIFFASPHAPYQVRYPHRPAATARDRYLQEVTRADHHLGGLLGWLESTGRLERTVVVVTSDHGEEFGEHGGSHHKSSAHTELRHVPLVVRIPGVAAARLEAPVAVAHVLPWLLMRGEGAVKEAARARITREIGPLLRDTGGARVVELLGVDRVETALVYPDRSVYLDLLAGHASAFDLSRDPFETRDVWLADPGAFPELRGHADRYLAARAHLRRFSLAPTKTPPGVH